MKLQFKLNGSDITLNLDRDHSATESLKVLIGRGSDIEEFADGVGWPYWSKFVKNVKNTEFNFKLFYHIYLVTVKHNKPLQLNSVINLSKCFQAKIIIQLKSR